MVKARIKAPPVLRTEVSYSENFAKRAYPMSCFYYKKKITILINEGGVKFGEDGYV